MSVSLVVWDSEGIKVCFPGGLGKLKGLSDLELKK